MRLWRITRRPHANLDGQGGLFAAGRWHSKGQKVFYASEHPSLAILETLVHLDSDLIPNDYVIIEIEVADELAIKTLNPKELKSIDLQKEYATRAVGDKWLAGKKTSLLKVPSVLIGTSFNFLINPDTDGIKKIKIKRVTDFVFDARLLREATSV